MTVFTRIGFASFFHHHHHHYSSFNTILYIILSLMFECLLCVSRVSLQQMRRYASGGLQRDALHFARGAMQGALCKYRLQVSLSKRC